MEAIFTGEFKKQMAKVRDGATLSRLKKAVEAILSNPEKGKFLGNVLAGKQSMRVTPFRLIFEVSGDSVIFHTFEHRGKVYR